MSKAGDQSFRFRKGLGRPHQTCLFRRAHYRRRANEPQWVKSRRPLNRQKLMDLSCSAASCIQIHLAGKSPAAGRIIPYWTKTRKSDRCIGVRTALRCAPLLKRLTACLRTSGTIVFSAAARNHPRVAGCAPLMLRRCANAHAPRNRRCACFILERSTINRLPHGNWLSR